MKRTLIKTDNLTLSPGPPSIYFNVACRKAGNGPGDKAISLVDLIPDVTEAIQKQLEICEPTYNYTRGMVK